MNENFYNLTDEELKKIRKALDTEVSRRKEIEREKHRAELEDLLARVNELQEKHGFVISCDDDNDGSWISSAIDFTLME